MDALDDLARQLLTHIAAPLTHAVRMMAPTDALAPWRALTRVEQETVVLLLAAIVDPSRDPERALHWLTGPVLPEHSDAWVESPRPLDVAWSMAVTP